MNLIGYEGNFTSYEKILLISVMKDSGLIVHKGNIPFLRIKTLEKALNAKVKILENFKDDETLDLSNWINQHLELKSKLDKIISVLPYEKE